MPAMRVVGANHHLPAHANVHEERNEYVVELDVADFTESELAVESVGRRLIVRGEQAPEDDDEGKPFRLRERLEESFRLPDDADPDQITVLYEHGTLAIRVRRTKVEPRRLPIEHPSHLVNPDAEPV
jgi:HSP20 family molecular chaperone IbpA